MTSEELKGLVNIIKTKKDLTPLELFNIQLFVGIEILGREKFKEVVEDNIAQEDHGEHPEIKITRWQDGTHFYAMIWDGEKYIDVIDKNNNVKWNSYKDAFNNAKKFKNNYNKENKK